MNKNKEWEEEFDKEFQDLNNLYPETGETLKSFISKAILSAEDNMRKRCVESLPKEIDIRNTKTDIDASGVSGFNSAIYLATQNINNLDKRK